jgi:hypothetical protein
MGVLTRASLDGACLLVADAGAVKKEPLTINLSLDVDDDCLTGLATDGNGGHREFSGWLGLLAAIDALLEKHAAND